MSRTLLVIVVVGPTACFILWLIWFLITTELMFRRWEREHGRRRRR